MERSVQRALGAEPSAPHPVLEPRIESPRALVLEDPALTAPVRLNEPTARMREPRPNREVFNEAVIEILGSVLESHPFPCDLQLYGKIERLVEPERTEHQVKMHTFDWLQENGFITASGPLRSNAKLTLRGLAIMDGIPDLLKERGTSFGQEILKATRSKAIDVALGGAKELVAQLIRYALKQAGT